MTPAPKGRSGWVEALLLLPALLAGAAGALSTIPWLVRSMPTELLRIRVVLDALRQNPPLFDYVVLGDSVAMNGLDGNLLSELLPGSPPVYNLATPGQGIGEAGLFAQEIPPGRSGIVFFLSRRRLGTLSWIPTSKYNAFYLNGFRPDRETRQVIVDHFPDRGADLLEQGTLWHHFQGRWAFRQALDQGVRDLLRTDLDLRKAVFDLAYPRTHPSPGSAAAMAQSLQVFRSVFAELPERPLPSQVKLLDSLIGRLSQRAANVLIVIPPLHPELVAALPEAFRRATTIELREIAGRHRAQILDLEDEGSLAFLVDAVHPNEAGTAQITIKVARLLGGS